MLKTVLAGALASGALLGGSAQAQGYGEGGYGAPCYGCGYDAGVPAYAAGNQSGYGGGGDEGGGYAPYRPRGFTLLGVRAGVTVLGVDVDGSAKLTVGAHGWGGGHDRPTYYAPPSEPVYAPQPEPMYVPAPQPIYVRPSWGMSYGYGYCGC